MVLIPAAVVELAALVGGFEVLAAGGGVVEDEEPPHAASPTTAAAASTEAANHRLRIVSTPFATVTRSAFTQEHVKPGGVVQRFFDESQAAMRWQSQASDSGYR
jgi:hypothetical protein